MFPWYEWCDHYDCLAIHRISPSLFNPILSKILSL